jgi:hypothetical protein
MADPLLAVLIGVTIFVFGQWIVRFFIDPIQKQRQIIGEIFFALTYYSGGVTHVVEEDRLIAIRHIRRLAAEFRANTNTIPFYRFLSFINLVEKRSVVTEVTGNLIGWSNTYAPGELETKPDIIAKLLGFDR